MSDSFSDWCEYKEEQESVNRELARQNRYQENKDNLTDNLIKLTEETLGKIMFIQDELKHMNIGNAIDYTKDAIDHIKSEQFRLGLVP